MQVHALDLNDFHEEKYSLIGIHTTLEDYKLAYVLNHHLKVRFNRAGFNLDFENEKRDASFSIYTYENSTHDSEWYLIANSEKKRKQSSRRRIVVKYRNKKLLNTREKED